MNNADSGTSNSWNRKKNGKPKCRGLLARLREPIDFEAIDGQPIDIVFLLLLPAASQLEQLNAPAAVARKLRDPEVLRKLREAPSATALYTAVTT
jgi:PTS system nitrogen regulatory IIA component